MESEKTLITPREKLDILIGAGKYKLAYQLAEKSGMKLQIKDKKGTYYYIHSDGSVRRTIPKKRKS